MSDRRRNRTLRSPGKEPGTLPLSYAVKLKFKERNALPNSLRLMQRWDKAEAASSFVRLLLEKCRWKWS